MTSNASRAALSPGSVPGSNPSRRDSRFQRRRCRPRFASAWQRRTSRARLPSTSRTPRRPDAVRSSAAIPSSRCLPTRCSGAPSPSTTTAHRAATLRSSGASAAGSRRECVAARSLRSSGCATSSYRARCIRRRGWSRRQTRWRGLPPEATDRSPDPKRSRCSRFLPSTIPRGTWREREVARALALFQERTEDLEAFAAARASALLADHLRVREAGKATGSTSVQAVPRPDVIGVYVLLPRVD